MGDIFLTLEKSLKRLNPHLILESSDFEENERHRVSKWLDILPRNYLVRKSCIESDIYDNGRLKIRTDSSHPTHSFYTAFHEPHVTEFRKKYG